MRFSLLGLSILIAGASAALADDAPAAKKAPKPAPPVVVQDRFTKGDPFPEVDEDQARRQEQAALAFVKENDPELAALVERLKGMKQQQYARAIRELFQVSQNLSRLKENDPRRYAIGLEAWKAKSRVEVLSAKLANGPSLELEDQLRGAVEAEYDVNLRRQTLEREIVEARLKKLDETIERLRKDRDRLVETKYQFLFRKSMEAGNFDTGTNATASKDPKKGKGKK